MIYDLGSDDIDTSTIDIVLCEWFDIGGDPYLNDLENYMPESYRKNDKGIDRHYYRDNGQLERNFYEAKWDRFVADIKHAHRFFNPQASDFLGAVFGMLSDDSGSLKPEVIRTIEKGQELFRARVAHSFDEAKHIKDNPVSQLGPTPNHRAGSQRMTPNGISALYCALERETCLSEIRSITGDSVVSGALTPTRTLNFLDLTRLELAESPKLTLCDKGYLDALHLKAFVNSLVNRMSKPKGRNDELSYLSTQVVFEYLRLKFGTKVDGLVFPSVQTGGKGTNVVLFPEACIISKEEYFSRRFVDLEFGAHTEIEPDAFKKEEKLAFVAGSIRFHRITAIETKAAEYTQLNELFMDEFTRRRLEPYFR